MKTATSRSLRWRIADRRVLALVGIAGVVGLVVAARVVPDVLYDDAAITFRYAARIASAHGFTFNDGDRTNGASAPLYALLLAVAARFGVAPPSAAVGLGVGAYGAVVALVGVVSARLASRAGAGTAALVAAATAVVIVLTSTPLRTLAVSGMESILVAAVALAVLLALSAGRTTATGVLLGIALVLRADTAVGALAVVAALWVVRRRPPVTLVVATLATALPWVSFSWWYFGSPLPYSATQKLSGAAGGSGVGHTWVLHAITGREGIVVAAAAVLAVGAHAGTRRRDPWARATLLATTGWLVVHVLLYSVVDLGAPYPWYTTIAYPLIAVGAGVFVAGAVGRIRELAALRAWNARRRLLGASAVAFLALMALTRIPPAVTLVDDVAHGAPPRPTRLLDATRRDAGRWLAHEAAPGDVIRTCFGWVAYEAIEHRIDEVCPLSTRAPVPAPAWYVDSPGPDEAVPDLPAGARLAARFGRANPNGGRDLVTRVARLPR